MKSPAHAIAAAKIGYILVLTSSSVIAQSNTVRLQANPFNRPGFVMNLGQAAAPAVAAIERPAELELRATMVASDAELANINGEVLRVGESIGGYRIVRITEGRVMLRNGSEDLVLDVYQNQRASETEDDSD